MDLADQLYAAEERIRDLEKILGLKESCPISFQLSRSEKSIFGMLLKRGLVDRSAIASALYSGRASETDYPDPRVVDVLICHIRRKIKPFEIVIQNVWGQGYMITPEHKAKVAALLEAGQT